MRLRTSVKICKGVYLTESINLSSKRYYIRTDEQIKTDTERINNKKQSDLDNILFVSAFIALIIFMLIVLISLFIMLFGNSLLADTILNNMLISYLFCFVLSFCFFIIKFNT